MYRHRQRGIGIESLFDDGDMHVDRNDDRDLTLNGVLADAEETLDAKMPPEEQPGLPTARVKHAHLQVRIHPGGKTAACPSYRNRKISGNSRQITFHISFG